jgi:hypothetical protein
LFLECFTLKKSKFSAQLLSALLLAGSALGLTSCANKIYYNPQYNYAGRTTPPSGLLQRVMVSYTANGSTGGLEVLDGLRDLRSNVQNTKPAFFISGYSGGLPEKIFSFPEEQVGYILSQTDGSLTAVSYGSESSSGVISNFGADPTGATAAPTGTIFAGAQESSGQFPVTAGGANYVFTLPGVYRTFVNPGATVVLAMVHNSNTLYRLVKLNSSSTPVIPPGSVDCQPLLLPNYCVVPVGNTNSAGTAGAAYDHPIDAYFSLDGSTVYILNCGPECGGTTSSVLALQTGPLNINTVPTVNPLTQPAPLAPLPVANPIPVPGGATDALADSTYLYVSGQNLQSNGLLGGNLTLINLNTGATGAPISISDGTHTRMLFADNNTLWIGSQQCANGVRAAKATQELASQGYTDQAGNYNCLTMVQLGTATPTATIVPAVVQSTVSKVAVVGVPFPNTDQNQYYYGSLTGLCWVQAYGKVYTGYGGQVHAFYTGAPLTNSFEPGYGTTPAPGTELNNFYITVQGTVFDVAYIDALTNADN